MFPRLIVLCSSFLLLVSSAAAEVTLPAIFSDRMVVQRDLPIHVWGMAAPGESVSAEFHGTTGSTSESTTADDLGRWSLYLPPSASGGPFTLTLKSSNTITFQDVLVGDVWVASGQSNMEFAMRDLANASSEVAAVSNPRIRFIRLQHRAADYPRSDVPTEPWELCNPQKAPNFSAVAYYFAQEIEAREHVPIGIIESAWGGTVAEAWTSMRTLSDASLSPIFRSWATMQEEHETHLLEQRHDAELKASGKPVPEREWLPELHSWAPGELYNGMIAPLTPFAIHGVIWYQGESNSKLDRAPYYNRLFPAMIRDWRARWSEGDFPFLFVQISSFNAGPDEGWPMVREAQRETLQLHNTAMSVTTDIGDAGDVHPKNKKDVGHRLALAARSLTYGENIEYSGPLFRSATREEKGVRVWFDHASGMVARGGELKGFEIAGDDGKFVPAKALIEGSTILVSGAVTVPKMVRYNWANVTEGNLFNREGLPASPFRGEVK